MVNRIRSISLLLFVIMISMFILPGCKSEDKVVLRVANCEDYIDEELLDKFTEETGIIVEYLTYSTNENLYNELVINPNSYDLVVPSDYMIVKLASEGRLNKLDKSMIPVYTENISPYIQMRLEEMEFTITSGEYSGEECNVYDFLVGYMWGTMGWIYNTEKVDIESVRSYNGVFDDERYNKKVTIKDSVRDTFFVGLCMVYQNELMEVIESGENVNERLTAILSRCDKETIDMVGDRLSEVKEVIYGFEVDTGKNDIVTGKIDANIAWSGDAAAAIDEAALAENGYKSLSYYVPDEGSNIWFDGFVMPNGSNNYDAVYKFLDFISRGENVVQNMEYLGYTSVLANDEIYEYILDNFEEEDGEIEYDLSYFFGEEETIIKISEESYGRFLAQYPTLEVVERCAIMGFFDNDTTLLINDMWERVKGTNFSLLTIWLIIIFIIMLALAIILYRNKDKINWIKLPERKSYAERKGYEVISREEYIDYTIDK